jgi:type IV secretory pathway protease TraF
VLRLRAFALSLVVPGLGLLTTGRALPAFAFASLNVLAGWAWTRAWVELRFSFALFYGGLVGLPLLSRVASGAWAAWAAGRVEAPRPWQRPVTYGAFALLFLVAGAQVSARLEGQHVQPLRVATPVLAPEVKAGGGVWLVRSGPAAAPRKGALVALPRPVPANAPAAGGLLQVPQRPLLGRVAAVGGDTVEITTSGVFVNAQRVADGGEGVKPLPLTALGPTQLLLVAPGRDVAAEDLDSRDLGLLSAGDVVGTVGVVLGEGSAPEAIRTARWLMP